MGNGKRLQRLVADQSFRFLLDVLRSRSGSLLCVLLLCSQAAVGGRPAQTKHTKQKRFGIRSDRLWCLQLGDHRCLLALQPLFDLRRALPVLRDTTHKTLRHSTLGTGTEASSRNGNSIGKLNQTDNTTRCLAGALGLLPTVVVACGRLCCCCKISLEIADASTQDLKLPHLKQQAAAM